MAYKPYRGKKKGGKRTLAVVLSLLLILLSLLITFFVAQEYIVFTSEGFRFELPFMAKPTQPPTTTSPDASDPVEIIIDTTSPPTTTEPVTTEPPIRSGLTGAALISMEDYLAGAPLPEGAASPAIIVKDVNGLWAIPLNDYLADEAPTPDQQALAQGFKEKTKAVISVYKDHENAAKWRKNAVTVGQGLTWLDISNNRWFSPFAQSDDPQTPDGAMLAAYIAGAAVSLGADEIILTNFCFPTNGRLSLIDYGAFAGASRTDALKAAAFRIRDSHGASGDALLSCLLTEICATEFVDAEAGQDIAFLAEYFDILYVPTADPNLDIEPLLNYIQSLGHTCRIGLWLDNSAVPQQAVDYILLQK